MLKRTFLTAFATIAIALTPGAAVIALADDPPPSPLPSFRPPTGVLRHVDAPTASPAATAMVAQRERELVMFVGGYQTCSCDDHSFDLYAARATAAGYDVKRFGTDAAFPYDTYGHVANSGRTLRDEIRALSEQYAAIHIVTHSMGGVVVDQAFAQGLSAADGVATYIALSAPHSGSDAARGVRIVNAIGDDEALHRVASLAGLGFETRSDAVGDLATIDHVPAPTGVVRLDLRESTDVLVTGRDATDPGVPSRVLRGSLDGHGGILTDPSAIDLTFRTIAARRVPPDDRSQELIDATDRESAIFGDAALVAICLLTAYFCLRRFRLKGALETVVGQHLPLARRKPCP